MTSRLKRKLNDLGVDTSGHKASENFCLVRMTVISSQVTINTCSRLEHLFRRSKSRKIPGSLYRYGSKTSGMSRVDGDYMARSQEGSLLVTSIPSVRRKVCNCYIFEILAERNISGWTPSTFTSSRSERAKKKELRPEDYMDEEDLAELRESRKLVDENEEMDLGSTETELRRRTGTQMEDECVIS